VLSIVWQSYTKSTTPPIIIRPDKLAKLSTVTRVAVSNSVIFQALCTDPTVVMNK
jgi:hypothetical protein